MYITVSLHFAYVHVHNVNNYTSCCVVLSILYTSTIYTVYTYYIYLLYILQYMKAVEVMQMYQYL